MNTNVLYRLSVYDNKILRKVKLIDLDQNILYGTLRNFYRPIIYLNSHRVSLSSSNPNFTYTKYGSKLTLAPKSSKALSITWSPIT